MIILRLVNENKTYIHLSMEGMEAPNSQCVIVEADNTAPQKSPPQYIITFENGRKIVVYLTQYHEDISEYIFNKRGKELIS